jgi:predicted O-methyltransferase YrrM
VSNRTLSIDDRTYNYICDYGVTESELLRELREETASHAVTYEFAAMQISPEQGQFMTVLMKALGVKKAIELGTFTGYSSICIASGLPEDGELICCDTSDEWTRMAVKYWSRAGVQDRISLHLRPAEETLSELLKAGRQNDFDFVFIDADKQNYIVYYELALKLVKKGGLIAVDNTLWSGSVADPENMEPGTRAIRRFNDLVNHDKRVMRSMLTLGDGLTLIVKEIE